ncbi:hypothetical protein EG68_06773, partial [Paragonimus skrjabini miyazakii]
FYFTLLTFGYRLLSCVYRDLVFSACQLTTHYETGKLATLCSNDPIWQSPLLVASGTHSWLTATVELLSTEIDELKDYKVCLSFLEVDFVD